MKYSNEELKNYIKEIQPKYLYKKVYLFGSRARGNYRPDSDIDLLIEFDKSNKSIFMIARLINDLQDKFNLKVDIISIPLFKPLSAIDLDIDKKELLYA